MIGFVLRGLGLGGPSLTGVLAGVLACCAMYGLYKISQCRLRHCPCCRWCLRVTGSDAFDDFELVVFIHEVTFTACDAKMATKVRVTAGDQEAITDSSTNKQFHQPLLIDVEQGTETLLIELMNAKKGRVLAKIELDIAQDILKRKLGGQKRTYAMKELSKEVVDCRMSLTFKETAKGDEEEGLLFHKDLLEDTGMDDSTKMMMEAHLAQASQALGQDEDDGKKLSPTVQKMRVIAKGCCGPVEIVGGWGGKSEKYLAVEGPPEHKKFKMELFDSQSDFAKGKPAEKEIQLLRVRGVAPHPQSDQAFVISHFLTPERKEDLMVYSMDRNRQVWVESLSLLVKMMHEAREDKKPGKKKK